MQLTFLIKFKKLSRLNDYMQHKKNEIEVEWVLLYRVLKYKSRFIVRLKAIKYNNNSYCYLSFYTLNLSL